MKLKALIMSLGLLGLMIAPAFAAEEQNAHQAQIDQINSETAILKKQLAALSEEVTALKEKEKAQFHTPYTVRKASPEATKAASTVKVAPTASTTVLPYPYMAAPPRGEMHGSDMDRLIQAYLTNLPVDWDNPGQSYVSIGPYLNTPIQFTGNNLIINDPKINTDVALLKLRKAAHEGMVAKHIHTEDETHHSHLLLSGNIEGQGQYIQYGQQGGLGNAGNNGSSTNFDLSAAELDGFLMSPSPWVSGFFSFSYDNSRDPIETNSRVLNSRLFLNNAFIIVGDFTKSPLYGTIGQIYVPFGTYSSVFVTSPLTKPLARTKARAFVAGYQEQSTNAFYGALYAFRGDSHASATSRINNGGVNLGYRFDLHAPDISGDFGMGYLANIADAVGMQDTGGQPQFNGFGGPLPYGNEKIVHRVPALDFRGRISIGQKWDFIAEYIGVTTSFNPNDMTFKGGGATPWGLNTEAAYTFKLFDKPSSLGIGYSQAREALALSLPERRYGAVFNTSIWHNTIQSIEFRHDINYAASATATGSNVLPLTTGLGTADNVVTLQFDVYF